ncbi:hypothetical protein COCSUDRAFT_40506 [Coccomyxa subellipsoidea C-169]|uniref:AP2/ERF domain-containing protein n=1 Tax=Coccomyxa subellipsoidea (strain C-169) TaxID=574566 RepID=I0Z3G1_COCSC|nr:hypothetical protein COCSUDRAFT_40506 [Coccomyxa subellipsoidea C-169]EIE25180.1 hypothetical protein COCSUDRAFT_40506 [Coccomyxa subellipsoidea C-169]|eukprot:XP_005649724.1 hypothetical protein COCSUDRAFT_40506 [Coccomyxa subellipsoidea C-169]
MNTATDTLHLATQGTSADDFLRYTGVDLATAIECLRAGCVETPAHFAAYMRQGRGHSAEGPAFLHGKEAGLRASDRRAPFRSHAGASFDGHSGTSYLMPSLSSSPGGKTDAHKLALGALQTGQAQQPSTFSMEAENTNSEETPKTQAMHFTPARSCAPDKSTGTPNLRDYIPSDLPEPDPEQQEDEEEAEYTSSQPQPVKAEQCDLDKEAALLLSLSDSISGGQNASQEGSRRAHQLPNMPVFPEGALSTPEQRVVPVPSDDKDVVNNTVGNDQRSSPEEQAAANRRSEALKPPGQGKSEYVGVTPFKNGRWKAECSHGGKKHHLGIFDKPEEAATAYDQAALYLKGPRARLNFAKPYGEVPIDTLGGPVLKTGREGTAPETGTKPAAAAYRKCKAEEAAFTPVPADERYSARAERVAKRIARPRTSADIIMPAAAAQAPRAVGTGAGMVTSGALGRPVPNRPAQSKQIIGAPVPVSPIESYRAVAIDLLGKYEEKAGKGAGAAETGRRKARGKANAPETGMPAERACRKRKGSDREDAVICAMMSMPVEQQGAARAERAAKRSARTRTLASADIPMPDPVPLAPCATETGAGLMTSGALGMPVIPASPIASSPEASPATCLPSARSRNRRKSAPKRSPS